MYGSFANRICIGGGLRVGGKHTSGNQKAEQDANEETEVKIKEIKEIGKQKGGKVVEDLVAAVTNVTPEPRRK